jgi:hypothetical protein
VDGALRCIGTPKDLTARFGAFYGIYACAQHAETTHSSPKEYMHACLQMCVYMCVYVVQACWHTDTSYIHTYVYIRMNIGTHSDVHKCINTYIHTCTHIHIAVLTASCESQHQCGAVSGLVMSLSPSARITYSLAGTIKFEMPISEVSSVYIYTHRYAYTYTSTKTCIDTHIEMDINMHANVPTRVPFQSEECAL